MDGWMDVEPWVWGKEGRELASRQSSGALGRQTWGTAWSSPCNLGGHLAVGSHEIPVCRSGEGVVPGLWASQSPGMTGFSSWTLQDIAEH